MQAIADGCQVVVKTVSNAITELRKAGKIPKAKDLTKDADGKLLYELIQPL
tara:strand:- start:1168 stop:1320 length:153 start_codon:yes stop_codon:yes gene_type:complete